MNADERATKATGMSRRSFIKAGGAVLGGAAITGLNLETGALEAFAADGGRALREGGAADVGISRARLDDVAARVRNRIDRGLMPGAVVLVARHGQVVLHQAMGAKEAGKDAMTKDTLFDLESNTKVLATAISYMLLVERRAVSLSDPIAKFLPHFATNGKEHVTLRDMLRYSSGLPIDINLPGAPNLADVPSPSALWTLMEETPLEYPTGTKVEYSDLTYRLLGHTFEAITGQNLQQFAKANVWSKLGMTRTTYNPLDNGFTVSDTAATGPGSWNLRTGTIRGVVEDDFDWVMGGIVGCDGLFSTAHDIAVFLQLILNDGSYGGVKILSPSTVRTMTADQTPQVNETVDVDPISNLLFTHKGYGWELWTHRFSSGGMRLTPGSFGKAGGAGTFFWVDRRRDLFGVFLTNHGLPVPFDGPGWAAMLDNIGVYEFYDGVINSLNSERRD
ncbi:MAG: serine hydrolase [Candidatus Dormibacteraeota bacterium]|nr:serine hydrolase [Candidatus Dormibacteraeota bacterium]